MAQIQSLDVRDPLLLRDEEMLRSTSLHAFGIIIYTSGLGDITTALLSESNEVEIRRLARSSLRGCDRQIDELTKMGFILWEA